ncbi:MAG: TrkA C-terminal domain-containing protein [Clostridia bacterium]|nr:TrkA C-terminal domain-containing protein [Clostridia bacterium]
MTGITTILILLILTFVVEFFSIALKLTGLDLDKARFQVISIITNTGFTTMESELISQHPTRRKIAQILMLLSYVGYAALIGLVVNIVQSKYEIIYIILSVIIVVLGVMFVLRNKPLVHKLENYIERILIKKMAKSKKYRTVEEVLKLNDEFGVAEFMIEEGSKLNGITLKESDLTDKYIQVLNVDRGNHIIHFPKRDLIFKVGDKITVYGNLENIKELVVKQYNENI